MSVEYLAICTRCKKSIFVERNLAGQHYCPSCGENFDFDINTRVGFLVDANLANEAYSVGEEYFKNTDFREALRFFQKALDFNPNHYPAVYQMHMCRIYEEEQYSLIDIGAFVARAVVDSVESVLKARVDIIDRINFLALILKQSYIMLSKYYSRRSNELIQKEDWNTLRNISIELATALKTIIEIDKESMMASNPAIVTSCLGIADIGISACQFSVLPRLDSTRLEGHVLDLPTDLQFKTAKKLCGLFMTYAQLLDAGFSCSAKTDYGPALFFIDKFVVPKRTKYYQLNTQNQKRFLSLQGELLNSLVADSIFAARFAHRLCYKEFLSSKTDEPRTLLVYESVDNCLDSLMPRVRVAKDKKVDIVCKGYNAAHKISVWLNDFLTELAQKNLPYAIDKVDSFFGLIYAGIKKHYNKVAKKYRVKIGDVNQNTQDIKYYFNFLYQIAKCGILGFLIKDVDRGIVGGNRGKLLDISKLVVDEFKALHDSGLIDITTSKFNDFLEVADLIRDSQIYYGELNKTAKPSSDGKPSASDATTVESSEVA